MTSLSNKFYIVSFAVLFITSTTILLIASTSRTPVPAWGGYLDVGIVILIAFTGMVIYQRNKSAARIETSHKIAVYLFPVLLVLMWLYRNSLDVNILLPGLAWRTYFFLSILPHGLTLWKLEQHP